MSEKEKREREGLMRELCDRLRDHHCASMYCRRLQHACSAASADLYSVLVSYEVDISVKSQVS